MLTRIRTRRSAARRSDPGTGQQPVQFVGQFGVMTLGNGLDLMGVREYDPALGRFTTPDPDNLAGGDINLYRYAQSNPVNLVDPTGRSDVNTQLVASGFINLTLGVVGVLAGAGVAGVTEGAGTFVAAGLIADGCTQAVVGFTQILAGLSSTPIPEIPTGLGQAVRQATGHETIGIAVDVGLHAGGSIYELTDYRRVK